MNFKIEVNNQLLETKIGETILDVLKRNGINVPTLCHMKDTFPSGACRMCIVENETTGKLITSCSYPTEEGMKIKTHSPRVIESRKTIVELLLSNHPDDCLYCVRNKNCELQNLSKNLDVRERKIRGQKNKCNIDSSSMSIQRDPEKCILCGRCVNICEDVIGVSAIDFINRGSKTIIGPSFNKGLNSSSCVNCGQCIMVCPTGALTEKSNIDIVQEALNEKKKHLVVQYAPAISVSLAESFKMEAGKDINGIMNTALRMIGFNSVFDTTFGADLTIIEESAELIDRITNNGVLPMITSCCPAWVKYAEEFSPDFIPNISSCKSPMQMTGAIVKSYYSEKENINPEDIFSVAIMPCTAKKFESQREEMTNKGISDVDAVLTTRELAQLIHIYGIDIHKIEPEATDSPLGTRTGAGKIFGTTGGVMEAAIRTTYFNLTNKELVKFKINEVRGFEKRKEAKIKIGDLEVGVAVVNGLVNAKKLLDEIKNGRDDIHFIEVMACTGGCIAGGGQIIGATEEDIAKRAKALYTIDENETLKVSHKNPEIIDLYNNFLEKPLGKLSHKLLHTSYSERDVLK
jgi:NADP-reducing hydrogenase subunit HndD